MVEHMLSLLGVLGWSITQSPAPRHAWFFFSFALCCDMQLIVIMWICVGLDFPLWLLLGSMRPQGNLEIGRSLFSSQYCK